MRRVIRKMAYCRAAAVVYRCQFATRGIVVSRQRRGAAGRVSGYSGSWVSHTSARRRPLSVSYAVAGRASGKGRGFVPLAVTCFRYCAARCACVVSTSRKRRPAPSVTALISPAASPVAARWKTILRPKLSTRAVSVQYGGSGAGKGSSAPGTRADQPRIHHGP